jgi:hypothetical protein
VFAEEDGPDGQLFELIDPLNTTGVAIEDGTPTCCLPPLPSALARRTSSNERPSQLRSRASTSFPTGSCNTVTSPAEQRRRWRVLQVRPGDAWDPEDLPSRTSPTARRVGDLRLRLGKRGDPRHGLRAGDADRSR